MGRVIRRVVLVIAVGAAACSTPSDAPSDDVAARHAEAERKRKAADDVARKAEAEATAKAAAKAAADAEQAARAARDARAAAALTKLEARHDEFTDITWYRVKLTGMAVLENRLECYLGSKPGAPMIMRSVVTYDGDGWIFAKGFTVLADGERFTFPDVKFDRDVISGSNVRERADQLVDPALGKMLRAVAVAKNATIRIEGDKIVDDGEISAESKAGIARAIDAFSGPAADVTIGLDWGADRTAAPQAAGATLRVRANGVALASPKETAEPVMRVTAGETYTEGERRGEWVRLASAPVEAWVRADAVTWAD